MSLTTTTVKLLESVLEQIETLPPQAFFPTCSPLLGSDLHHDLKILLVLSGSFPFIPEQAFPSVNLLHV